MKVVSLRFKRPFLIVDIPQTRVTYGVMFSLNRHAAVLSIIDRGVAVENWFYAIVRALPNGKRFMHFGDRVDGSPFAA